ncbi:unnamed protein product [Lactuca saligna]|uniref:Uncharacterized protein n=1 Tax=Lactuca saligna TaxID=75948 RepID=A0AA35ZMQ9_LACSI|nr:unnamed protein product [Lactuca saligna]
MNLPSLLVLQSVGPEEEGTHRTAPWSVTPLLMTSQPSPEINTLPFSRLPANIRVSLRLRLYIPYPIVGDGDELQPITIFVFLPRSVLVDQPQTITPSFPLSVRINFPSRSKEDEAPPPPPFLYINDIMKTIIQSDT